MTTRRKPQWAFPAIFQALTGSNSTHDERVGETLSARSKGDLFTIARSFDQVSRILDPELSASPALGNGFNIHTVLLYLQDDSYTDLWTRRLKDDPESLAQIDIPILVLRNTAVEHYAAVQDVIEQSEADIIHYAASCIRTKLNILHGFGHERQGRGYNRLSLPSPSGSDPYGTKKKNEGLENESVSQVVNSTLIGVASIITTMAFIPSILAWSHSDGSVGAHNDMDFWLLIQSSAMQLLGIFLAVYSLKGKRMADPEAWNWTVLFAVAGSLCACGSIAMYLTLPTFWSGFVSFCGSASQIWTAVILAIVAQPSIKRRRS